MAKIMVVDDAMFMRKMLSDIITRDGHTVCAEADNGLKAIDMYKITKPDAVFMDITMPELNGIESVKQIIAIDPSAKIVMCSAMGQQGMVIEAIQAGAKDFIVKPFVPERLLLALNNVLKS